MAVPPAINGAIVNAALQSPNPNAVSVSTSPANLECLLHGIVVGSSLKQTLEDKLTGICGKDSRADFWEHEVVYKPTVETPPGPSRNDDVLLRLRSQVTPEIQDKLGKRVWQLCFLGNPEVQRWRTVTVRPATYVTIRGDAFKYMTTLGYSYAFEVVRRGVVYVYSDILRITVAQMFKSNSKYNVKDDNLVSALPPFSDQIEDDGAEVYLVEVTTSCVTQEGIARMAEVLTAFKKLLSGVVELETVDHRALANKVQYST